MMQTRAGRCPQCKEETPPGAEICPACGSPQEWVGAAPRDKDKARSNANGTVETARSSSGYSLFTRLFVLFVVACVLTFLAVTYRARVANRNQALEAGHAILVQDAESFRDQLKTGLTNGDSPEATYVIGVALPNGKDILEVTVKREWQGLAYPERLHLAARLSERWQAAHLPHRAGMTILDEAGKEIGGRVWDGKVWVVEQSEEVPMRPTPPPVRQPNGANPTATPTVPDTESTPTASNSVSPEATPATPAANAINEATPSPSPTSVGAPEATPTPRAPDDLSDIENQ